MTASNTHTHAHKCARMHTRHTNVYTDDIIITCEAATNTPHTHDTHAQVHAYTYTHIHTYTHTHIHTFTHSHIHTQVI